MLKFENIYKYVYGGAVMPTIRRRIPLPSQNDRQTRIIFIFFTTISNTNVVG